MVLYKKRRRVTEVVSTERGNIEKKFKIHIARYAWNNFNKINNSSIIARRVEKEAQIIKKDDISSRRRGLNWKHRMFTKWSLSPRYLMLSWRHFRFCYQRDAHKREDMNFRCRSKKFCFDEFPEAKEIGKFPFEIMPHQLTFC